VILVNTPNIRSIVATLIPRVERTLPSCLARRGLSEQGRSSKRIIICTTVESSRTSHGIKKGAARSERSAQRPWAEEASDSPPGATNSVIFRYSFAQKTMLVSVIKLVRRNERQGGCIAGVLRSSINVQLLLETSNTKRTASRPKTAQ
jgi:hypothetical protein